MAAANHRGLVKKLSHIEAQDVGKDNSTKFVSVLRACAKNKDLCRGSRLHEEILRRGLLEECCDALVTMYSKCGELAKAKELFHVYRSRDVCTWTALIAGCVQRGQDPDALDYFERMQCEGLSPDAVTFTCVLKACGSMKAVDKGEKIHDEIGKQGLLVNNAALGNALVSMYAKCGSLVKARQVLEELPIRDVISWTVLVAGYAQQGEFDEAFNCLEKMKGEGIHPNAVTFLCILKACGSRNAAEMGEKIHEEIAKQGLLGENLALGTTVVDMYAKCGALDKAKDVLEELPVRDAVSWNALIAGFAEQGEGEQALSCYRKMQSEGLFPNVGTYTCILKACGSIKAVEKGAQIHDEIAKQGLLKKEMVLGTALVDMYAKCGALSKARRVLEELPVRDVTCWNALMTGYAEHGKGAHALDCYESMQHEGLCPDAVSFICLLKACSIVGAVEKGEEIHDEISKQGLLRNDIVLGNALVNMYAKCGALTKAQHVMANLPNRNATSWNGLIAGYTEHNEGAQALRCFEQMQHEDLPPDPLTFVAVLKACGIVGARDKGEKMHRDIIKQGLVGSNIALGTALVEMYAKCRALGKARHELEELLVHDTIAWSALITAFIQQGEGEQALNCYEQMQHQGLSPDAVTFICLLKACGHIKALEKGGKFHEEIVEGGLLGNNIALGNALIDMYVKCRALTKARQVLEELPHRDILSWNTMIAGYAEWGEGEQALTCFERMKREGTDPDAVTLLCALKACGSIGSADKGENIHDEIAERGLLGKNVMLGSALVDMYSKCGALAKARQVLEELPERDVVSWNALLAGYAQQCQGAQVLTCLELMQNEGVSPDLGTFSCALSACSRSGLWEDAETLFSDMSMKYGVKPDIEHYTCMVDLFGRVGHLAKAIKLIEEMPSRNGDIWSALLGACRKWGDVEVGRWAFEQAVQADKSNPEFYLIMADIYTVAGMQEDARNVEGMRVENEARNQC